MPRLPRRLLRRVPLPRRRSLLHRRTQRHRQVRQTEAFNYFVGSYQCPYDRIEATNGEKVLTLDLTKHLGPDLGEALFVAVDFMYFKEMMDVPAEMLFKVRDLIQVTYPELLQLQR